MTPHVVHHGLAFDQTMGTLPDGTQVILFRDGMTVHGWRNSCPHVGVGLDYGDGRCLAEDGRTLFCALHFATFDGDTGYCTGGPCAGKALTRIPLRVVGDDVVWDP